MRKKLLGFVLVAGLVGGATGCVQKEGGPVRETSQPGENGPGSSASVIRGTMKAIVAGKEWVAEGTASDRLDDVTGAIDPATGVLTIRGHRQVHHAAQPYTQEEIEITLKQYDPGDYLLSPDFDHTQTALYCTSTDTTDVCFIHENQEGHVTITRLDTTERRIFGTFEFEARNAKGKDVKVQSGMFENVRY